MKLLHSSRVVEVPEGISLEVKARQVRVKGPRGELDGASPWSQALEAGRRDAAGAVQAVRGVTEAGVEGAGARKCTEQSQDYAAGHIADGLSGQQSRAAYMRYSGRYAHGVQPPGLAAGSIVCLISSQPRVPLRCGAFSKSNGARCIKGFGALCHLGLA